MRNDGPEPAHAPDAGTAPDASPAPSEPATHRRGPALHHRARPSRGAVLRRRWWTGIVATVAVVLLAVTGAGIGEALSLTTGIHRSSFALPSSTSTMPGVAQNDGATNILVMGLDSRLDENGNALPANVYNALHAGDQADGGYNTNVLMLIHIPAGDGKAVGISIPRDDYVNLPGCPYNDCTDKIKEAYGLELAQEQDDGKSYQQARAAARQEEITTVSQFLGGVPINHFIEVTMAAFYELAVAVAPIEVCLNETTADTYSGANFHKGYQWLSASQAVSFVRQRRDTTDSGVSLTDLDRERRQQAFIISLAYKLRKENVFTNLPLMNSLINTASNDIALDSGFDLLDFASDANRFAAGGISFITLPITGYATIDGEDVNEVDLSQIRTETAQLIAASDASSTATTPTPTATHSTSRHGSTSRTSPKATTSASASATPSSTPSNVYTDPTEPMTSGAVPCVN